MKVKCDKNKSVKNYFKKPIVLRYTPNKKYYEN